MSRPHARRPVPGRRSTWASAPATSSSWASRAAGKTTVAHGIAAATGLLFAEADDFHSRANVDKMSAGTPLDDADRWPWLHDLAAWMGERAAEGRSTVIACSALKRAYRDVLAAGPPSLDFVHLDGPAEVIRDRIARPRRALHAGRACWTRRSPPSSRCSPTSPALVLDVSLPPEELVVQAVRGLGLPVVERTA